MNAIEKLFRMASADVCCNTSYPISPRYFLDYRASGFDIMEGVPNLSFYFHIPFCRSLCRFCEYTRVKSGNAAAENRYVDLLERQTAVWLARHSFGRVEGLDVGGGTPTSLNRDAFARVMRIASQIGKARCDAALEPSVEFSYATIDISCVRFLYRLLPIDEFIVVDAKPGSAITQLLQDLFQSITTLPPSVIGMEIGIEQAVQKAISAPKPVALEVPKRGAGRRQTTSAVGIPNQSQVHTFRREALGRTPCPEGFTNAKDFATVGGAIETWKCHENADIRRLWIPQEIKDIQSLAFKGCPNLEEVVCEECGGGEGLSIGLMTFAACPRLCRVVLPARLCGMGKGAFRDDGALMEFSVPKDHYPIVCENHLFDNCPCPDGKLAQLL